MNPIQKAIESTGGLTKLATLIGTSPQAVTNWRVRGVPAEQCPVIERVTGGAVRCEELRPDVEWAVLRNN